MIYECKEELSDAKVKAFVGIALCDMRLRANKACVGFKKGCLLVEINIVLSST